MDLNFFKNKKIFITGHSGFKGSWLCKVLLYLGADIYGYALKDGLTPSLFEMLDIHKHVNSFYGDIRDFDRLLKIYKNIRPELVIHLAAQPIVRESYIRPRYTYETNVMGTVNILECIRNTSYTRSFLNVTTDKVYENKEWIWGYRENEKLDGFDPYSNSKSCSELVTHSYKNSFFSGREVAISTARAGNVIGGGDFSPDRIVPDCVRAAEQGIQVLVRNPNSVRPYQHVLDPLYAYLLILSTQYSDTRYSGYYNVGPNEDNCIATSSLVDMFCKAWGNMTWRKAADSYSGHEANILKLDSSLMKSTFGWNPKWDMQTAIEKTVEWERSRISSEDISSITNSQIRAFLI